MSTPCPFRISRTASDKLARNEAFRAVRENLRRQELGSEAPCFCSSHRYSCSSEAQESFRLHRDIIHTLLLPLFLLHNQASRVAVSILPGHKEAESERAFRGEARDAYAWLHCIFSEEHDWYMTERCPACIVLHVLHSEPTIRLVAVACLLSDKLLNPGLFNSNRRLPSFNFWLEALEIAVCEDPFWGADCWPDIEYRAYSLIDGVQLLALQCLEFQTALDRQTLQSITSYKANFRFQRDVPQSLPAHPVPLGSSDCSHLPLGNATDSKQRSKLAASRCLQSHWADRPRRFHTRREADTRSRSFYSTPSPFEERIGYYRAVRHGQQIFVSGTTAADPASPAHAPQVLFPDDARQQTRVALLECIKAVQALGGRGPENVVRVRMFVSRPEDCTAVGEGFTEVLGRKSQPGIGAAATLLVVRDGFVDARMLVEIEVDAIVE
ncbi:Endoribonuclease L-PSP/chorismate mutase-like protein [Aspergillus aurantiobrunneus]